MGKTKKDKKTKAKKDKDAPKRAISAFFFYNKERRETLKKEQPNLDNKQIISTMSKEWNELSEEKKKPYIEKAEADKKRYEEEKKKYDAKNSEKKNTKGRIPQRIRKYAIFRFKTSPPLCREIHHQMRGTAARPRGAGARAAR